MTGALNWSHYDFSTPEGIRAVKAEPGISEVIESALLDEDSRPRTLVTAEGTLLILRGVNLNPGAGFDDMISIRVWAGAEKVVSTGRRRLRSVESLQAENAAGKGPASGGEFICRLVGRLNDFMGEAVEELETRIEEAENQVAESRTIGRNSPFSLIRRQCARVRRYLGPQREALEHLLKSPGDLLNPDQVATMREEANRLTLVLEDLDLVRERAMVAQEEFLGIMAHEQNERMLLLSIVAAVFLPLSFVTGLFGMNVAGLPGTAEPKAFLVLMVLMTAIATGILLLFRHKRWF